MRTRASSVIALVAIAVSSVVVPITANAQQADDDAQVASTDFEAVGGYGQVRLLGGVPDVGVALWKWVAVDGELSLAFVTSTPADDFGSAIFRDVQPGSYLVGHAGQIEWLLEVKAEDAPPPDQSFYSGQELVDGYQYIETRDGTLLSAHVVLPGPIEDGPYPTVVEYSGYDPSNPTNGGPAQPGSLIASAFGYAIVGVNVRGSGCSGGAYDFFEEMQVLDGYDVIETVAAQSWVKNNHVGMVGLSYPGISQLFVAKSQPPSLAGITPLSVYGDTATGVLAPGGLLNTGFATSWASNVLNNSRPNGTGWVRSVIADGDTTCADNQRLRLQNVDAEAEARANAFYTDEVAGPLDIRNWASAIDVPVFLASAYQDEQTGPSFGDLLGTFWSSPSSRAMIYNGLHADGFAPQILSEWSAFLDLYVDQEIPAIPEGARQLAPLLTGSVFGGTVNMPPDRWGDVASHAEALARWESEDQIHILFEDGGNPAYDSGLPIASWVETTDAWPVPETEATRWWFTADGELRDAPADPAGTAVQFNPNPAESQTDFHSSGDIWDRQQTWDWKTQAPGNNVRFETAPLDADVVMAGTASVDFWMKSDATDAELEAVLSEIRPDGQEMRVQSGQLQVSYRALDASSTELKPVGYGYEAGYAPLVPGEWVEVRMQIPVFAHAFRAGSAVRLEINTPGGDTARWQFELDGPGAEATHVIGTGVDHPSSINLPVIAGWEAQTDIPGCTLRGQPCRDAAPIVNDIVGPSGTELPEGYAGYVSEQYGDDTNWMCYPGKADDVCARDLDVTEVAADGTTNVVPFEATTDSDVDCFYIYPTVSNDQSGNSDLIPQETAEIQTTLNQTARFGSECRVFAPVYRQVTLGALFGSQPRPPDAREIAYGDVVDAFKEFIANQSSGGDFVLIGHSQGSGILAQLIAEEIDNEPLLRDRMLSALLLGTSVAPDRYDNVEACTSSADRGCVLSFSSYRDTDPAGTTGIFGTTGSGPAMCFNPAGDGPSTAQPIFPTDGGVFDDPARDAEITTPWVSFPDMLSVQCVNNGTHNYLEVALDTDDGPRRDDINGDFLPRWGLHIVDANVVMGDLVDFVAAQRRPSSTN